MNLKFECPNCKETIPTNAAQAGKSMNCPKCDWIIAIPKFEVLNESRDLIKFLCPSCNRKLSATTDQFGTEMPCPYTDCENPILVPRPEWGPSPLDSFRNGETRPVSLIAAGEEIARRTPDPKGE